MGPLYHRIKIYSRNKNKKIQNKYLVEPDAASCCRLRCCIKNEVGGLYAAKLEFAIIYLYLNEVYKYPDPI